MTAKELDDLDKVLAGVVQLLDGFDGFTRGVHALLGALAQGRQPAIDKVVMLKADTAKLRDLMQTARARAVYMRAHVTQDVPDRVM